MWPSFARLVLVGSVLSSTIANVQAHCNKEYFDSILPAGASTLLTHQVAQGGSFGEGPSNVAYPLDATNLPASCAVIINVTSSATTSYTFGLFLPDQWNKRFIAVGNGGFVGGINWYSMGSLAPYGFATMSTNTGHNSTGIDLTWAFNNTQSKTDWGYRAMHGSVVLGKQVTNAYYNGKVTYSYYAGCSTGGKQGMKEVEMFPEDFDGVLVGAPAWWSTHQQLWQLKVGMINLPENSSHYIPPALFPVIADEVLRQCDTSDGVKDGIIMDPKACNFYPDALLCTSSSNKSTCLTALQINTLQDLYRPIADVNNTFIYPNFGLSSERQMYSSFGNVGTNAPSLYGTEYVRQYILDDLSWQWQDFNYAIVQLADKLNPGGTNANNYDLSAFHARGGKLLHYHGTSDGLIPTGASEYLYKHIKYAMNEKNITLDDWYRFFLIPGMQHCGGSVYDAPWYMGGAQTIKGVHSVPGFGDKQHDVLLALMDWVEKGNPVEKIVVTKWRNDTTAQGGVVRQRPVCPYPMQTVWDGKGNVNVSESWSCAPQGSARRGCAKN